jgi:hypothetical protein
MPWLGFERRWRDELCAAVIPRVDAAGLPGLGELDTDEFWSRFATAAPADARAALRLAVWILTLTPLLLVRRPTTFRRLSSDLRDQHLDAALRHRFSVIRDLAGLLKLVALLAYFGDSEVRVRVQGSGRP